MLGSMSALVLSGLAGSLRLGSEVDIGGWQSDFAVGSEAADRYTRARIARHGLLALARTEAVYFVRDVDDRGRALTNDCRYRVAGGDLPAEWWSITLYDGDSMLPANDDDALSVDATVLGEGAWDAIIAPSRPDEQTPWISSRGAREFDLTLRLYLPEDELFENPQASLSPPSIARLDCGGGT
jgi:hypothetical protein